MDVIRTTSLTTRVSELLSQPEGHTVPLSGSPMPYEGFYVGGSVPSLVTDTLPSEDDVHAYVDTFPYAEYAGIWTDSETGKVYVDIVDHYNSAAVATHVARTRGELAVWDISGQQEVRV